MELTKIEIPNYECHVMRHQNANSICFFKKNSVE